MTACKSIFIWLLCIGQISAALISQSPVATLSNPNPRYSLVNSVDFHPTENLCCVTYTHEQRIVLFAIDGAGQSKVVKILENPCAQLSHPQHAVFSADGNQMIVANWTNQTLTIYQRDNTGSYYSVPAAVIPSPSCLENHKPHGIACSPCGNFLAVAYGAAPRFGRAIALFRLAQDKAGCELVCVSEELSGIPKGITFSPDGACLLVTFSDLNCLAIFELAEESAALLPIPKQVIQGDTTKISRPEDVKISRDGTLCALSNSDQHTVTFYPFDAAVNRITQSTPMCTLQNPEARLSFPHGIAFSPDGAFVLITQFGPVMTTQEGDISWGAAMPASHAKVHLFRISLER